MVEQPVESNLRILRVSVHALCLCGENSRRKSAPQRHRESTETQRKLKVQDNREQRPGSAPRRQIYRIPNERKRAPGLTAMLWPEGKQHDAAFSDRYFGERDLVLDALLAAQPARL